MNRIMPEQSKNGDTQQRNSAANNSNQVAHGESAGRGSSSRRGKRTACGRGVQEDTSNDRQSQVLT